MTAIKVVQQLIKSFGDRVKVCSQYHVQVESAKGLHDIWVNKEGCVKCKFAGERESHNLFLDQIIKRIESYTYQKTHFEQMQEMLDLARFVKQSERDAKKLGSAIFTDAGFKDGKARIAAIFVNTNEIDAKSKFIDAENNSVAELAAINLGLSMDPIVTVYNDSLSVVTSLSNLHLHNNRVKWLPRAQNNATDKIANMRSE